MSKLKNGVKELFGIAKDVVSGKDVSVPKEVFNKRYSICKECPNLNKLGLCNLCGCSMFLKCQVATSSCPDNPKKWDVYED